MKQEVPALLYDGSPKNPFDRCPKINLPPRGRGVKNIPLVRSCGPKNAPWSQDSTPETTSEHSKRRVPRGLLESLLEYYPCPKNGCNFKKFLWESAFPISQWASCQLIIFISDILKSINEGGTWFYCICLLCFLSILLCRILL